AIARIPLRSDGNTLLPGEASILEAVLKSPELALPNGRRFLRGTAQKALKCPKGAPMPAQDRRPVYRFGGWEIDLARAEMRLNGTPAEIGGRAFEIVETLVGSAGELIDKYDLMNRVWPGAAVEENTLQAQISAIRKALGPDRGLLKTIAGRGYRLLGDWVVQQEDVAAEELPAPEPARGYATNLTAPPSALIGRKDAEAQLLELLSAYRMVTMTGPGGIGKTVLAQAVARNLLASFGGDGLLVELVALTDPALVPFAVATVLGLRQG